MSSPRNGFVLHLVAQGTLEGVAEAVLDRVVTLRQAGWDARFGFVGGDDLEERLDGIPWAAPVFAAGLSPLAAGSDIRAIRNAVEESCDLIHCHLNVDHFYATQALRRLPRRVPVIRSFHHEAHARRDPLNRFSQRHTRRFLAVTEAVAKRLRPNLASATPLDVLHTSIDPHQYRPRARPLRDDVSSILPIGRIGRSRAVAEIIDIAQRARKRGHEPILLISPGERTLYHQARKRGLKVRITISSDRSDHYREAAVALSVAPEEARGHRWILEALASGLPVVAVGVDGSDELIRNGVDGFVTASGDLEVAAGHILSLAVEPGRRERMGEAARRRVLETFADPILARRLGGLYDSTLAGDGRTKKTGARTR